MSSNLCISGYKTFPVLYVWLTIHYHILYYLRRWGERERERESESERRGGGGERLRHSDETTNSAAKAWTECLCADTSRDTGFMVSLWLQSSWSYFEDKGPDVPVGAPDSGWELFGDVSCLNFLRRRPPLAIGIKFCQALPSYGLLQCWTLKRSSLASRLSVLRTGFKKWVYLSIKFSIYLYIYVRICWSCYELSNSPDASKDVVGTFP